MFKYSNSDKSALKKKRDFMEEIGGFGRGLNLRYTMVKLRVERNNSLEMILFDFRTYH